MNIAEAELKDTPPKSGSFRHILVATDFSRCSERALAEALALAIEIGAELSLVHVLRTDWRYEMLENPPEIDLELSDARELMDACVRKLPGLLRVQPVLITKGPIAKSLLRAAMEQPSDLIVVGTRGRGGLPKLALGSVAEELLRLAPCPVMTVGPRAEIPTDPTPVHPILFATDFGKGSAKAVNLALDFAYRKNARLILLHMTPPMPMSSTNLSPYAPVPVAVEDSLHWEDSMRSRCLLQLKACLPRGIALQQEPEYIVGTELCAEGILSCAERLSASLIVMGANQVGSAKVLAHLPWTAVHEVIRRAPCPVLTVAG
ncbi:MAG TPA: universal stress protein [Candidatus Sulfotelmatobacter sp.]|nr:universal stress protein [Candidatus Sulfotelmatobacter sp.]